LKSRRLQQAEHVPGIREKRNFGEGNFLENFHLKDQKGDGDSIKMDRRELGFEEKR
jgi:hypothetical protein